MPSQSLIIQEIQRVAKTLGRAPGIAIFERETGIKKTEWHGVYWRSWGNALIEAGFQPNKLQTKYSSEEVILFYAEAVRHFGRIPANVDLRMYGKERPNFPAHNVFTNHFKNKAGIICALRKLAHKEEKYSDLLNLLPKEESSSTTSTNSAEEGFVYLLRSGKYFKIGKCDDIEKRIKQIRVALPEATNLEHSIRTDDPTGIELYWHRRFHDKRANGEWFNLSASDVRAFKRRKFQ